MRKRFVVPLWSDLLDKATPCASPHKLAAGSCATPLRSDSSDEELSALRACSTTLSDPGCDDDVSDKNPARSRVQSTFPSSTMHTAPITAPLQLTRDNMHTVSLRLAHKAKQLHLRNPCTADAVTRACASPAAARAHSVQASGERVDP